MEAQRMHEQQRILSIYNEKHGKIVPTKELYKLVDSKQPNYYVNDPEKRLMVYDEIQKRKQFGYEQRKTGNLLRGIQNPSIEQIQNAIIKNNELKRIANLDRYCKICKKKGHDTEYCWYKNDNHNRGFQRGRGRSNRGRGRTTMMAITDRPQGATFSMQE